MSGLDASSLFSVKGQVVLVTGGGRGVGEMIATGYVQNGAKVYISSRTPSALKETADKLNKLGKGECIPIVADLSKYDDCVKLAEEMGRREKVLNVLVNNSGATWGESLETYPDQAFTKLMTLNVQRVFTLSQKLVPLLKKGAEGGGVGRIINIGSINGEIPPAMETYAYSSSKAALHHLSRHLASRLAPDGINVNTLALGPFPSKMMAATLDKFKDDIVRGIPLGRVGEPSDVVGACLWLSGKAGQFITGATVPIEGGHLIAAKL